MSLAPLASAAADGPTIRVSGSPAVPVAVIGLMGFMALIAVLAIGFLVFWVLMLIDCAKREWPDKNTWIIILVVSMLIGLHWLSAIIYYVMIKRAGVGTVGGQNVPPQPPAPPATPPPAA